jgi:hypothetical protein
MSAVMDCKFTPLARLISFGRFLFERPEDGDPAETRQERRPARPKTHPAAFSLVFAVVIGFD